MCCQSPNEPFARPRFDRACNSALIATVSQESGTSVVHLVGDLDIGSCHTARDACLLGGHDVIVDLARVTFMDSCGYGALVSASESLQQSGLSMTMRNVAGQPARLVGLLAAQTRSVAAATR